MRADSPCSGSAVLWYACTTYDTVSRHWGSMTFADEETWCQETGWATGCLDVRRVAVHELGHVAGLARSEDNGGNDAHSTESESYTVMRLSPPRYAATGSQTHNLQECDVIELQREYDVAALTNTYPACVDHISGTTGGKLDSTSSRSVSTTIACPGELVVVSGVLRLETNSYYGLFSANGLGSRSVTLERRPAGGSWADYSTFAAVSSGSWSGSIGFSSGTYDLRIRYSGEATVNSVNSPISTVTWTTPC